ncbi:hypothetical protein L6164_008792 [Bauhinia variegata]|uniref:Uncharacterized protein n=1 Tax=Bauhinia variegata TaxID=167791 RepID=A0ACB9PGQ0_BAUVA|nr:hypothetical protein L6164_008792 [Bauhinia variegata]
MATKTQALIFLFSLFTISCSFTKPCHADCVSKEGIAVFWGQRSESEELTLREACATGNYKIILLDYLIVYEDGSDPDLNLASHCGWAEKPCTILESQIKYCQSQGIKVVISIGEDRSSSATRTRTPLRSEEAAKKLAAYLWNNYLSSQSGPLGAVALDGVSIFEVSEGKILYWDEILEAINDYSTAGRKIYLGASPQCADVNLGPAIRTNLVDYAFVEFYYDPGCSYDSTNKDPKNLLESWNTWISKEGLTDKQVFLGLPASKEVTGGSGFIEPEALKKDVLPVVKQASNYGGVLLFDRTADISSGYSDAIKNYVPTDCRCVCDDSFPFYNQALVL